MAGAVENSLSAMMAAYEAGFDGIECDVRVSADSVPCIHHDSNLKRMCGVDALIEELTYEEISNIPFSGTEESTPSLEALLAACSDFELVNLEVKAEPSDYAAIFEQLKLSMKSYPSLEKAIVISSFDPAIIPHTRKQFPELRVGLVVEENATPELNKAQLPDILLPQKDDIARFAGADLGVPSLWTWTVKHAEEMDELASSGSLEAIITECAPSPGE